MGTRGVWQKSALAPGAAPASTAKFFESLQGVQRNQPKNGNCPPPPNGNCRCGRRTACWRGPGCGRSTAASAKGGSLPFSAAIPVAAFAALERGDHGRVAAVDVLSDGELAGFVDKRRLIGEMHRDEGLEADVLLGAAPPAAQPPPALTVMRSPHRQQLPP